METHRRQPFFASILRFALIALPASLFATTVEFDDPTDLDSTFTHAKTTATQVTHAASSGVGASGAIRLRSSANADSGFAAVYSPATFNATGGTNVWTTSVFFDTKSFGGDPAPFLAKEKEKIKVSLGFSGTNSLTTPNKFFDKKNTNNPATFRAQIMVEAEVQVEHDTGKQARIRARLRSFPSWDQETASPHLETSVAFPGPYNSLAAWFRLDFRVEFLGNDQFKLSYELHNVGQNGTASPGSLVHQDTLTATNAALAQYGTVWAAVGIELEKKSANWKIFHLDNFSAAAEAILPGAPTALAATSVLANAAIANWETPTDGAATTGYVLEITTASDNFAPNTFIAADGTPGQASGIAVANPSATSLVLDGLSEGTDYVYRVRSTNNAGASTPSNVIAFTTLEEYVNAPPTLDPIGDVGPVWPNNPPITVPLAGITAGLGDTGQTLTVTATSSNPAIVPDPTVTYTSPDAIGSLALTPSGGEGTATITVTVDDGETVNNTIARSFTFTTRIPPARVDFDNEAAILGEFTLPNTQNANLFFDEEGGIGDPPTGGLYYQGVGTNDNGAVFLRNQPYFMVPLPSLLRNSILINARELAQNPSGAGKHQAEVEIGFRNEISPFDPKAKDFFSKGGSTTRAASIRLQFQHEPAKSNIHSVKARIRSFVGTTATQSPELAVQGDVSLYENWLRLSFEVVPLSTTQMLLVYQLHNLGPDGINQPELVLEDSITVTNGGFLTAPQVYAGFVLSTEKNMPGRGVFIDGHKVDVLYTAPEAPIAHPATQVTSLNASLNWQRANEGAVPFSFVLELSDNEAFPPHSFIATNGTPGQSAGIAINSPTAKSLHITGLQPGTTYFYRVRGSNGIGESNDSNTVSFTTLAPGVNAPPTLDPIPDVLLTVDSGEQTIPLKGISDGGELNQTVTLSATTSDPQLIQDLEVFYNTPLTTGELVFTPALNVTGSATITITADDGAPNNNTLSRTFTVTVIKVDELIPFDTAAEFDDLSVFTQNAGLAHVADGGVGPQPGMLRFSREATNTDKTAMVLRPYAYDARAVGYWITSLFIDPSEVGAILSGKDKAEVRLGFVSTDQPDTTLKDTFHKTQTGLGVKFKLEHEPASSNKNWLIEAEAYCSTPNLTGGFNETKGGRREIRDPGQFANWLKLVVQVVRKSATQYEVLYAVEDWGPHGEAFVSTLLTGPAHSFTNASFAKDPTIHAGFLLSAEKNANGAVFVDNHEVIANTRAPDSPRLLPAFDITSGGFTIAWQPAVIGRAITGFLVQMVRNVSDFITGLFIGTDGSSRAEGILIDDPHQETLTFNGLNSSTDYHWRVFAFNDDDISLSQNHQTTRTDALTFEEWREREFPDDFWDDTVSGFDADPDGDGIPNILEYALGGHPLLPNGALTTLGIDADGYLTISFRRRAGAGGVLYDVQYSTDLTQPWQSLPGTPVAVSGPDEDGMETVTFRDTATMNTLGRRFLRVRVELFNF